MELLIISILCSVSVGILFKTVKLPYNQYFLVFLIGYFVCFVLANFLFEVTYSLASLKLNYILIIIILSLLMPSLFYFLNKSIQTNGIIKTDLVQRLCLVIPLIASFTIFNELFSVKKFIGVILGLISIYLIMDKSEKKFHKVDNISLLFIFIGYGLVDVCFKSLTKIPFQSALTFVFLGCIITTLFYIILKKVSFSYNALLFGLLLGVLNFANIYTYMMAHKVYSESPTIVFATMNLGVISLGTLIGAFLFKEKISKKNIFGIVCAFFVILILTFK